MVWDFDLFVIGGGSGGVRAARLAAALGNKVGLAEEYRVGGTCVIRGCVPKKLFVYASHYPALFSESKGFGWRFDGQWSHDWSSFIAAKDAEIARLEALYRLGLTNNGVHIYESRARFIDPHTVELLASGERITAKRFLIATGGQVSIPPQLPGAQHCLTSDSIFDLPSCPKSIAILGAGYVAVEFGNIFHGFGTQTHVIYRNQGLLRGFDQDLATVLAEEMSNKGVQLWPEQVVKQIEPCSDGYQLQLANGEKLTVEVVMAALGRQPNSAGLGLEHAGVEVNDVGAICVDPFLATSQPHIWALGDVTNRILLTPVAIHEAMCFVETVFKNNPTKPDYDDIATAVFSQPELGTVGLSEQQAKDAFPHVEVYRAHFRPLRHTLSGSTEKTLLKLVVDGSTRRLLGAHVLGEEAGEMVQLLAIAVKAGLTKDVVDATMAVHPTAAEEFVTLYQPSWIYKDGKRIS